MSEFSGAAPAGETGCGLYVHIPFCDSKCGYCDFYSVAVKDRETAPLVARVARELRQRVADCPYPVRTVFLGGGTPTVLAAGELRLVLKAVADAVDVGSLAEYTVEANPATVDDEKARLLVEFGVTRVSMGAQSFLVDELAALERLHTPDDIAPSVATLRRNGVGQVNLDLIFGIPGQTADSFAQSLVRAIELEPDHIACYGLTYEPDTRLTAQLRSGRVVPCDENTEAELYLQAVDTLAAAGYEQYETSNYAKPDRRSEHNLIYWRNGPYIGAGPSAAGCIDARRYRNIADVAGYVRLMDDCGNAEAQTETVTTEMLMIEMVMMQLRVAEGLSIAAFRERCGADPRAVYRAAIERLVELGKITVSDTHIALTREGRLIADAVMVELVAAGDAA